MDICPSNTTECLLRAIFNAQNGYNWNPLTFGATVAIGVLALIVAATTVFQGALSAGPGRLKASSRAIGPIYYLKTKTDFSWTELRFRTTAWIPYIDHVGWNSLPHFPRTTSKYRSYVSYGAGWLNLIELIPRECQHWPLTRCQTDYLPSDVQAAPARASIRAVVELAALSGCDSITISKELPLARGLGLQLSFRDHPYLGLVAVYDQHLIEDDVSVITPVRKKSRLTNIRKDHILYLAGQFSFQDMFIESLRFDGKSSSLISANSIGVLDALSVRTRSQGELAPHQRLSVEIGLEPGTKKSMGLGLLTLDSPDGCRALPYTKLRIRPAALQLCQTSQAWKDPSGPGVLRSLYDLFQSMSDILVHDKYETLGTELAKASLQPKLGWTWLAEPSVAVDSRANTFLSGKRSRGPLHGRNCWFEWTPDGPGDEALPILPGSGNLILLSSTFDICILWLGNERLMDELTSGQKAEARANLGHQLHEVDYWLLHHGGVKAAEQTFGILMDFVETPRPPSYERKAPNRQRENSRRRPQYYYHTTKDSSDSFTQTERRQRKKRRNDRGEWRRHYSDDVWDVSSGSASDRSNNPTREKRRHPRVRYDAASASRSQQPPYPQLDSEAAAVGALEDSHPSSSALVLRRDLQKPSSRTHSMKEGTMVARRPHEIGWQISHEQLPMTEPEINEDRSMVLHRGRRESSRLRERPLIMDNREAALQQRSMSRRDKRKLKRPTRLPTESLPTHPHRSSGQLEVPELEQRHSSASSQVIRGRVSAADEGMRALLIYRAMLFATLCALAADTSCVFETELGRRVVQVL